MRTIIYIATFILFISCKKDNLASETFKYPKVIDTLGVANLYDSPNSIQTPINYVYRVDKFTSVIDLRDTLKPYKYLIDAHFLSDTTNKIITKRNGLKIVVDTTSEITIRNTDAIFDLYKNYPWGESRSKKQEYIDSISYNAVEIYLSKNPKLFKGLSVYITNPTSKSIRVKEQDWRIMMIQEALDKSGKWKPIEYWKYSECGNSYGDIALKPNHFIMTKVVKYSGNFKTKIRLKFLNDSLVYYSKPFEGSINLGQFDTTAIQYKLEKRHFLSPDEKRKKLKIIK